MHVPPSPGGENRRMEWGNTCEGSRKGEEGGGEGKAYHKVRIIDYELHIVEGHWFVPAVLFLWRHNKESVGFSWLVGVDEIVVVHNIS